MDFGKFVVFFSCVFLFVNSDHKTWWLYAYIQISSKMCTHIEHSFGDDG